MSSHIQTDKIYGDIHSLHMRVWYMYDIVLPGVGGTEPRGSVNKATYQTPRHLQALLLYCIFSLFLTCNSHSVLLLCFQVCLFVCTDAGQGYVCWVAAATLQSRHIIPWRHGGLWQMCRGCVRIWRTAISLSDRVIVFSLPTVSLPNSHLYESSG